MGSRSLSSEGYESWQVVSISQGTDPTLRWCDPQLGSCDDQGLPVRRSRQRWQAPFPDGCQDGEDPLEPEKDGDVPRSDGAGYPSRRRLHGEVCDSKRFADSGGWGYAVFDYDAASDTFKPGTLADKPPQGNDATCGFTCHTMVKTRDYVFTDYGHRGDVRRPGVSSKACHAKGTLPRRKRTYEIGGAGSILLLPPGTSGR